jgi:KDO2-lipid IV(A) lauroyltransferase
MKENRKIAAFIEKRDLPFLGFAAAALALRLVRKSSRFRCCHMVSRPLGAIWHWFDRPSAVLVRRNMEAILGPELSAGEVNALAREHFQNVALGFLVNDILPSVKLNEYRQFLQIEGVEHLNKALARGRGVILLGAHFGLHFYPPLAMLGLMGYPITAISKEEVRLSDSWVYHKFLFPFRRRSHAHMDLIHLTGLAQRQLADALKKNRVVLIMGDFLEKQMLEMSEPQVTQAPLLGHSLLLKTGTFRLARWLGSEVITLFVVPRGRGHTMVIGPPLELSRSNTAGGLKADLAAFSARFESYLSRYPALWGNWRTLRLLDLMQPDKEPTLKVAQISF